MSGPGMPGYPGHFPHSPTNAFPNPNSPQYGPGSPGGYYPPPTSRPGFGGSQHLYGSYNQQASHGRAPPSAGANQNAYYANGNRTHYPPHLQHPNGYFPPVTHPTAHQASYPTSAALPPNSFPTPMYGQSHLPRHPSAASQPQWGPPPPAGGHPPFGPAPGFEAWAAAATVVQPSPMQTQDRRGSRGRGCSNRPQFHQNQNRRDFNKRKREEDLGSAGGRPPKRDRHEDGPKPFQRGQNPNKKSSTVAPRVPSFGPPLRSPASLPPKPPQGRGAKKKKNRLGLTPKGEERVDSDEEEVDEEARALATMSAGGGYYNYGQTLVINLKSNEEIRRWIAERKKNYPTAARQEAMRLAVQTIANCERAARQSKERKEAEAKTQNVASALGLQGYSSDTDADEDKEKAGSNKDSATKAGEENSVPKTIRELQEVLRKKPTAENVPDSKTKGKETEFISLAITMRDADDHENVSSQASSSESSEASASDAPPDEEPSRREVTKPTSAPLDIGKAGQVNMPNKGEKGKAGTKKEENCKFKHQQPGVTDPVANELFALQQQRKHNKNLFEQFVEKEGQQMRYQALQFINFLGHSGMLDKPFWK